MTRYRSRYHRPRGFRNFRGDVFVFGDELIRLFGLTTSDSCGVVVVVVAPVLVVVVVVDDDKLFIQVFCGGKSLSAIFCTQTSG